MSSFFSESYYLTSSIVKLISMGKIQEIKFQTKEESNKLQEEDFLKLSPQERVFQFFRLCYLVNQFPQKDPQTKSNNFEIIIPPR